MFSCPVRSGWNPVPSSSSAEVRPFNFTSPRVGALTPESTLSSVLFPAPLRPMMPTVLPRAMSNDTSCSAQNSSKYRSDLPSRSPRKSSSRKGRLRYSLYILERSRTEIAVSSMIPLHKLRQLATEAHEVPVTGQQRHECQAGKRHQPRTDCRDRDQLHREHRALHEIALSKHRSGASHHAF